MNKSKNDALEIVDFQIESTRESLIEDAKGMVRRLNEMIADLEAKRPIYTHPTHNAEAIAKGLGYLSALVETRVKMSKIEDGGAQ